MEPNPIKLTIITVTYRDPEGLSRTLRSLGPLGNHAPWQWEHLVVDGDPDASSPVLSRLPPEWPLRHLRLPPTGIYPAMNAGIHRARGEFLWFLNGGDALADPEVLLSLVPPTQSCPEWDVLCAATRLRRQGEELFVALPRRDFYRTLLSVRPLIHQGFLYRREVFSRWGVFDTDLSIVSDIAHHFRLWARGARVKCVPQVLADFWLGGVSDRDVSRRFSQLHALRRSYLRRHLPPPAYWAYTIRLAASHLRATVSRRLERFPRLEGLRTLWALWRRFHLRYA